MPLRPFTRSWKAFSDHVTIRNIISSVAFRQVIKGTVVGLRGRPGTIAVAIKIQKSKIYFMIFGR